MQAEHERRTYFPRPPRRPANMPLPNRTHQEYRLKWRVRVAEECGPALPKNDREWKFCEVFISESVAHAMKSRSDRISPAIARAAGMQAVREAGFREKQDRTIATRATEMLALPRIQQGIAEIMAAAGVDVASIATVFAEILASPLERTVTKTGDDENSETVTSGVSAGDKLKAADLFFKVTTGYAPAKTATLHGTAPVDAFFDPEAFKKTPPIRTSNG